MKNRCRSPRGLRLAVGFGVAVSLSLTLALVRVAAQQLPVPIPGRNVNMVSGTTLPGGDPFLQRQNEPSIAVSTRNPLHLLGAANDYRTVDIPGLGDEVTGDAWLGIFKSFDGGATWKSTLLPGFRQDVSPDGIHSPLYGLEAAADPVIRAGTHGLFYMGGMAFNRDKDDGKVFVARYIDNNNLEAGDSIAYLGTTVIDTGSETRFLDKPWIAVDIPRAMAGHGKEDKNDHDRDDKDKGKGKDKGKDKKGKVNDKDDKDKKPTMGPVCQIPGQAQPIPAGTIYVMYSAFFDTATGTAAPPQNTEQDHDRDRDFGHRKRRERENGEDHTPGKPLEGRTLIMLARSTDCGRTFSNPKKISERNQINQGSVAAIDSTTGTIYVAWREFMSALQPDAILITKSTDGGDSFSTPVKIATIHPFDQGSSTTSFRTNAYPTLTVDGSGRVYVAWAERGIGPLVNGQGGDARIVISTSTDGKTWSAPAAADNPQQRGHQFMPVLSFGGGKLHLVWWDQRDDKSKQWGTYIDEAPILNWVGAPALRPSRHTIDLRGAAGLPGAPPAFGPSAKLSNYLEGVRPGKTEAEQLQFNAPNLPLFALGTMPFIGDYLDVTASPSFIANGDGTWRFNTLASDPSSYFTSWSDNRDVRKPAQKINGKEDWVHYTPPTFAGWTGTSIYDPTQPVQQCSPGMAGMRDQNIYSARVLTGLVMTTLGNTKPLGYATTIDGTQQLIQRSFVVTVTNPDPLVKLPDGTITGFKDVVLHINAQPVGGRASFLQFEPLIDLPVRIAPKSSISREVFVTSTDRNASVPITVTEGNSTATSAKVILNPDITNPDIENPDIENPGVINPDIENAEAHAITVSTPDITNPDIENLPKANPDIENPDIENPDIENPDIENPDITNPDIINPDIENPDIENPDIENPDIENPDIENPDIENGALTDVTWNVANVGNTATSYQVKLLLKQAQQQRLMNSGVKFQLVVTKTTASPVLAKDLCGVAMPNRNLTVVTINSPAFVDPSNSQEFSTVVSPDIENPDIENATVALAPGDTARVTLRVYSPVGDTTTDPTGTPSETPFQDLTGALTDLKNLGVVTTSHPVDTIAVQQGSTTPVVEASIPVIVTTTLPDAARTLPYTATIAQTGSTPPFSFSVTTGALPPGLTFHADGTIDGAPTASGVYTFTVRLVDANAQYATATLIIRVFEPLVVSTGALSGGVVNQAYSTTLSASGGFPPFTWGLAGGTLPAGVTLSSAGVLSGTPTQSGSFSFTAQAMDLAAPPRTSIGAFVLNVTPTANAQSVSVVEDTATPITVSGTGAAPSAFTFAIGNQPAHGAVTGSGPAFTYTPASNYNGPDSFTFSVSQGALTSAPATVTINVTAANDAPVATPKTVNTPQGTAVPITLTGTDAENSPLTFSIVTGPTTGALSGTAPNVTYTPPPAFTGTASFTFRVNDGLLNSTPATVTIVVGPPPANSADVTLALVDAPDPAALGGSITYTATITNNGPATATGVSLSLSYPAADLRLQSAAPSQGTCTAANPIVCTIGTMANGATVTVPVTLKAFNRGGTFTVSGTVSSPVLDVNTTNNAASQSTLVTGPAVATTDLQVTQTSSPNPVAFGSNTVYTIVVTNNGPSDATGVSLTNTFTAATAQFVSATATQGACAAAGNQVSCNVGALAGGASATSTVTLKANGSGALSNTATVTGSQSDPSAANNTSAVSTTIANRAPTAINDVATATEDGLTTIIFVLSNDTDPDGDTLFVTGVTTGLATHGTAQAVGTNTVYFTPAPDYHGPASFDYAIGDGHGGTATATVNVTVLSVNDAPSFVKGPDQSSGENGGPQTVPGWATAIATGPATANEGAQSVSFVVSNNNHFLFSAQPMVSPSGTLTYTAAPSGAGTATVTVTVQDDGGTDNGGVDASASQTFTITIGGVNDAPSFTAGPSQNIAEDSPLQTVPNWATYISPGPPDESGQLIDFIVSNNSNALFMVQPSVSPDGTLTYRPVANASGVATVTVSAHDNGGSSPGVDTSAPQTFTIAVYPVNDPPVALNDTVFATAGRDAGFNVLANDFDVESPTGSVVAAVPFQPAGLPANFAFPAEAAVLNSTGQVYISSGRYLGGLDPATHTVTSATPLAIVGAPNLSVVNQSTGYIYFRQNTSILAYDTATSSVAATLRLGGFQSFDLDEGRGLLYVSYTVSGLGPNTSSQPAVAAIDVNPGHTTFHQVLYTAALPPGFTVFGLAVNPATNKIYIASNASSGGVFVLDGATHALSQVAGSFGAATIAVNPANNLVFAGQLVSPNSGSIQVIDPLNSNSVSLVAVPGFVNSTTAPNKHLAVNTLTGRVYARSFDTDLTHTGNVFVIDGDRLSPAFKTVLASIPIGIDNGSDDLVVDEGLDKVVATSGLDFRIVVIDGATHAATTIAAGQTVSNVALVPGTHHAFVTGFLSMLDVDLATSSLAATVDVGAEAESVVVDPSSHLAYVGRANGAASVVTLNKDGLVGTLPGLPTTSGRYSFLAADPALHRLFVLDSDSNLAATNAAMPAFVSVVYTTTNAVMTSIPVGRGSFGMGINPVNHRVYVGGNSSGTVPASITVIDGTNNTSTTANTSAFTEPGVTFIRDFVPNTTTGKVYFRVNGSPSGITAGVISTGNVATPLPPSLGTIVLIKVNSALNRVYLGTSNGQVVVLDGANDAVVTTLNTGSPSTTIGTQSYLAVDESNGHVYVADFNDDSITVFDGTTNAELAALGVGRGPTAVAVNAITHRVYVGNTLDPSITFIDGTALVQSGFLPTPMVPNFIAVDEAESRIYTSSGSSVLAPTGAMVIADSGSTAHLTVNGTTNGSQGPVSIFAGQYVIYEPAIGASGTDTFTYTITDGQATSLPATVTVNITPPLTITTASLPEGTAGSAYAQTLLVSGGVPPYVWTVTSGVLPGGIVMTSGGAILGVPATPGNFTFTVLVTDSSAIRPQTTSRVLTLPVGPLAILTNSLASAQINQPYSFTMTVGGGTATPLVWTLNTNNNPLLNWLSVSSAGVLTGTPSTYGTTPSFTLTVTDALNHASAPRSYTIFVGGPLELTPAPREGVVLETQPSLSMVGGNGTRTATLTGGSLPPGLTLLSTGSFTGTPTRHGSYNFTVELRDCTPSNSCSAGTIQQVVTKNLALRVSAKDQQGSSASQPAIAFGGIVPGSRTMAQVVTVGAQGTLTGVGFQNISCPSVTPVTVSIQRLTLSGLPDGNTVASGTATSNYNAITVTPPLALAIDERVAFIVSSPVACTFNNAPTTDSYNGGDAFVDAGSGWVSLFSTDGRYDLPSFRTLIQPAIDVAYLKAGRGGLTATLLNTGKVLLVGNSLTAELYDPATNTSTFTGNTSLARQNHTATLLADGRVLIVGGRDFLGNRTVWAEIYDPGTGTFSPTGSLVTVRENHAATLLPDGRVLVTGGNDGTGNGVNYAEIFDPTANSGVGAFTLISSMSTPRSSHTSTLLANGKVLITGGYYNFVTKGDLFNPATNTFTPTTGAMVVPFRGRATATLLNDGKVLIAGGQPNDVTSTAEIYDPVADTFAATPAVMVSKRHFHTATLLADGSVLIAGGFDQTSSSNYILALATAERYLPGSGIFVPAGGLEARRYSHAAVLLPDNRVLIAGGFASTWLSGNSADVYEPGAVPSLFPSFLSDGQVGVPYTPFTLQGTYGVAPYQIDLVGGALPSGMAFASNTLSGTPGALGQFPLAFRVTDNAGHTNTQTLTLTVGTPHVITSAYSLPAGALNQTYTVPLTATGTPSIAWAMLPASNSLPPGLSLTPAGVITGAPTLTGFYSFGVRAVDAQGRQAIKTLSINVTGAMAITTTSLADPVVGGTYGNCVSRNNGVGPFTWSLTGTLPAGMAFVPSTGCFASVFPTNVVRQTGTFSVNVSLLDSSSPPQLVSQPYTFTSHAIDQLGSSGPGAAIPFGGAGGRSVAQVFTVGAQGGLSGVGLQNITCPTFPTTVTINIQRLTTAGLPDGITIASGSATSGYQTMQVSPVLDFPIDTRLAMVVTSSSACTLFGVPTNDAYMGGDALVNTGSGWVSLLSTDGRYDLPNFRTLIQPALPAYYPNTYKDGTAAALLNDGKVLLAGGFGNTQVEVYDPATNTTTALANMPSPRLRAPIVVLNDGQVFIPGGTDQNGFRFSSAVTFDPSTGAFTTSLNNMSSARQYHTATLLPDGRVLVAGGIDSSGNTLRTAQIYDPSTRTFGSPINMLAFRNAPTAVLLGNGKVLIAGGYGPGPNQTAELYDPALNTFTTTIGGMVENRAYHTATVLADGKVLLAGGQWNGVLNTAEIYDPLTDSFAATGSLSIPRISHTATLMTDGSVLIAGGHDQNPVWNYIPQQATTELYVPGSGTFVPGAGLETRRYIHSALRLNDGRVFLVGGNSSSWMTGSSAEFYDPATALSISPLTLANGQANTLYPSVTFTSAGGTGPRQISLVSGAIPSGMTFDGPTATLSGTPSANGRYVFALRVTDAASHSSTQSFTVRVGGPAITSPYRLSDGALGQPYSVQLIGTGAPTLVWVLPQGGSNFLPAGVTLSSSGLISGTPTSTGFFTIAVRLTDGDGLDTVKTHGIQINSPLTLNTTTLSDGIAGQTYGGCISYNNGQFPIAWSLSGQVPPGLAIQSSGCFDPAPSHTIRTGGAFTFTVTAEDSSSPHQVVSRSYSIRMHAGDQSPYGFTSSSVSLPSTRRVAETFRSGTPYGISGVELFSIQSCTANTQITAGVYPVTGSPARPDTSGSPMATGSVTASGGGFFNGRVLFASPVAMPRGTPFSVVLTFTGGTCQTTNWPTTDTYPYGDGWVDDGLGWQTASTAIGSKEVVITTLAIPDARLAFAADWLSRGVSATLNDGRVLVIGSSGNPDLYNPSAATPTIVSTNGPMLTGRDGPTATTLPNGKVLIVGGSRWDGAHTVAVASTEIFDPATGTFAAGGNLSEGRVNHTATLVQVNSTARVLIVGGYSFDGSFNVYGPTDAVLLDLNGNVVATLPTSGSRTRHTATVLADGRVLVTGGYGYNPSPATSSAEIYDPTAGLNGGFSNTASPMLTWTAEHTATLLTTGPRAGQVMLAGGGGGWPDLLTTSEFFDPADGSFTSGPGFIVPRLAHAAATLADGRIAFIGGITDWANYSVATASVEIYDPAANTFSLGGDLLVERSYPAASLVATAPGPNDGKLVVVGGYSVASMSSKTVELFDPASTALRVVTATLPDGHAGQAYSASMQASGGTGAGYQFSVASGSLPPGVSMDQNGTLSGTPTTGGVWPVVIKVMDSASNSGDRPFVVYVDRLAITTTSFANADEGVGYTQVLAATGVGAITWSLEPGNSLPPGLTLDNGLPAVTGIPTVAGWYFFTLRVTDAVGQSATRGYSLQVVAPLSFDAPTVSLGASTENHDFNFTPQTSIGTVTWSLGGGSRPPGLGVFGNGHAGWVAGLPRRTGTP